MRIRELRALEGCRVSLALRNGSRIDDGHLVSASHNPTGSVWLFINGHDTFVPINDVIDVWEPR
jgi:hypothetical protein